MAINLINTFLQFFGGNLAIVAGELGTLHACKKPGSQRVGVSLDQTNESVGQHHDRILLSSEIQSVLWNGMWP